MALPSWQEPNRRRGRPSQHTLTRGRPGRNDPGQEPVALTAVSVGIPGGRLQRLRHRTAVPGGEPQPVLPDREPAAHTHMASPNGPNIMAGTGRGHLRKATVGQSALPRRGATDHQPAPLALRQPRERSLPPPPAGRRAHRPVSRLKNMDRRMRRGVSARPHVPGLGGRGTGPLTAAEAPTDPLPVGRHRGALNPPQDTGASRAPRRVPQPGAAARGRALRGCGQSP